MDARVDIASAVLAFSHMGFTPSRIACSLQVKRARVERIIARDRAMRQAGGAI